MDKIKEVLDSSKLIVITTHKSPDGDAIGSSLALYHFLKKKGKEVSVIVPDSFPSFLNWMVETENIIHYDTQTEAADNIIEKADVIFSLDYNSLTRIAGLRNPIEKSNATKIVIDHHQDPQEFADHYFVDTDSCSTCQLIYEFIENLGELDKLDKVIGECIYCGVMTDTGSFRYPSTTSKTHQIIANLLDLGVENSKIHQEVYDNSSEHRLRLLGYALTEKMVVLTNHNAAYISLSQEELKRFSFKKGDTEGLVNYALSIAGIKFAALITEKEDMISLSLRSKDDFYVNKIANEHFSGGGHIYASGGMLETTLEEAISRVEAVMKSNG
ncbi:MAG: phosphoesterase [Flavobacteriales bacterium]|nr:MAG: phosphoesterase [Flavobacteriales bacterium]